MRHIIIVTGLAVALVMALTAGSAAAAGGIQICVPAKEGKPIVTPKGGGCKSGYTETELGAEGKEGPQGERGPEGPEGKQGPEGSSGLSPEELEVLRSLAGHIHFIGEGVAGKPTIQFSGVNVQVVSGAGKTNAPVNGTGNLIIGYDEGSRTQTGSHNLVLGGEQSFTSFGAVLGGYKNAATAPYASVGGGYGNTASGELSAVSGGLDNVASSREAVVSGGSGGSASGVAASVAGGIDNFASGEGAAVSGGFFNFAYATSSLVGGGAFDRAKGKNSVVLGYSGAAEFENEVVIAIP
jgi:hypothetical protein